ncbi:SH3 and multiple ankyrin repeat domains protein 3 isoform X2 [Dendroctonus ponderosae]|uniref:SH3 and multiple ankyrin repeat domains protein 3 isoform X2 n=1 Tax=Dendroctonus ponderosae TaxID=77166 RepID=UPI0020363499|nr:SH3 and multiple ankyrin repeat domains protein 3 isoform X2 [Dendroctonus ponderosae]
MKKQLKRIHSFATTSNTFSTPLCEVIPATTMEEEGELRNGADGLGYLLVRIHVPELSVQKCLQFPRDQLVWDVKQQCLAALPKVASWFRELKESFNYGLFFPPENGRAGKFLDEERRLGDYPFNGPVGYLELKYKRRVYKIVTLDEKQLKSLHTRANLRRFLDYVQNGQMEKVTKMCSKGLDPNFHCQESGETPLTIATGIKKPAKVIMALVNGGAILDYRTKDGSTALHRAVEHKSLESLKTLLELGASPNYKDNKGLTPLYFTVHPNVDPVFSETLLHDHATTGAADTQGWQEVHQACKHGLLKHLEHLLFYGADMNAHNASGNTPLHVCAVNGQESCARQLLFRGADRQALNYANQTPCQVAVIAGNMELAELIQNYRQEDVVPFRATPSYNPKRRSAIGLLTRAPSLSTLNRPPSPCPSDRSSLPFSSASSSLSDGSVPPEMDTASIVTVLALGVTDKSLGDASDIISDSSGVGTANSDTTNCSISMPGSTVVCIESYSPKDKGHIAIREGELIEITGATDDGYLEGNVRSSGNRNGLFPAHCVQEVKLRHTIQAPMMIARDARMPVSSQPGGRVVGRRESTTKQFATAPRAKKPYLSLSLEPRTVVLHKGRKGFGFILRGAKAMSPLMEMTPSEKCPSLQYLDDVEPGGVADMAGLKKGDFLLKISNEDVSSASHEHVVDLIRKSGNLVQMTVITWDPPTAQSAMHISRSTNLPGGDFPDNPGSRQFSTLPRKLGGVTGNMSRPTQAPLPPRRDPKTTLSIGRARAKSLVAGLGGDETDITKSSSAESITPSGTGSSTSVQPRTASVRQRPTSTRISHNAIEDVFHKHQDLDSTNRSSINKYGTMGSPGKGRVYASVAEMKRNRSKGKGRFMDIFGGQELRRNFHSTPDLAQELACLNSQTLPNRKGHRSQENLFTSVGMNRNLPPPNHPPPPPPQVHVLKFEIPRPKSDSLQRDMPPDSIASSFNPSASAKLYASPNGIQSVLYRTMTMASPESRPILRKSHSMKQSTTEIHSANTPGSSASTLKNQCQTNPYAQPFRTSRCNSSASNRAKRKKIPTSKSASNIVQLSYTGPPITPEPDYSCTDSEVESDVEPRDVTGLASRLSSVQLQPVENSGNSNTSGSSSGSNSVAHSFSVEEIQKTRLQLKSSKSYPDDFFKKQSEGSEKMEVVEDGDNSSSGVSSDQEITTVSSSEYHPSTDSSAKTQRPQASLLKRHAVSLAQLPPPIENENDEKEEFCLPPPPEFNETQAALLSAEELVVAPPPQFSDSRQVTRVRIVGAVPKGVPPIKAQPKVKQGRLHSQ